MERHALVGQQLEGPLGLAWGRGTAPYGNPGGFFRPIQETRARRGGLLFACPGCLQARCNKTLADVAHGGAVTAEGVGYVLIGPVGAVGIHVPQDMGMLKLISRGLPDCSHVDQLLACVLCESHNVFFVPSDSSIRPPDLSGMSRQASPTAKDKYDQVLGISATC